MAVEDQANAYDSIIIGAGIAGLTCAYYLSQRGQRVIVLERANRVAGWIGTLEVDGFLLETGPNTALAKSELLTLIDDLGIGDRVITASAAAKLRYVARDLEHPLIPFPLSPVEALTTNIVSSWAKLRLLAEPIIPRSRVDDQSFYAFCVRRFGKEVTEKVLAAVVNGILAPDIEQLSARCAFPTLWHLEQDHGSIVRGMLFGRRRVEHNKIDRAARVKPQIISFADGLVALPRALHAALGEQIRLNTEVRKIVMLPGGSVEVAIAPADALAVARSTVVNGAPTSTTKLTARQLISTEDSLGAAAWIESLDSELASAIRKVPYTSIGVVHFKAAAADFSRPIKGFGFLVPPSAGLATLGTIFSSSIFPHVAPAGSVLLTTFAGGMRNKEQARVDTSQVLDRVVAEVAKLTHAKQRLQVIRAVHIERAIPNPAIGHHLLLGRIADFEHRYPQLKILGNWRQGVSLNDRVREAKQVVIDTTSSRS